MGEGAVRFYPYKKGGISFRHAEGGGRGGGRLKF